MALPLLIDDIAAGTTSQLLDRSTVVTSGTGSVSTGCLFQDICDAFRLQMAELSAPGSIDSGGPKESGGVCQQMVGEKGFHSSFSA